MVNHGAFLFLYIFQMKEDNIGFLICFKVEASDLILII